MESNEIYKIRSSVPLPTTPRPLSFLSTVSRAIRVGSS